MKRVRHLLGLMAEERNIEKQNIAKELSTRSTKALFFLHLIRIKCVEHLYKDCQKFLVAEALIRLMRNRKA